MGLGLTNIATINQAQTLSPQVQLTIKLLSLNNVELESYLEKKIEVFNYGNHVRDFTYVDDIVKSIYLLLNQIPKSSKNLKISIPFFRKWFTP